jgi:predicted signal transduction protein with EAL and GGDEF domain
LRVLYIEGVNLSFCVLNSVSTSLLPYNLVTRHGIFIGAVIEITLFSLALAYKIKSLQNEKLLIIYQQNISLESMVAERTEELKELANRDPLTNLHNRRFLYEISDNIILLSKRENTPLSFIMFDLDNFKSINDTYGHAIGDKVIKAFCSENSKYT